MVAIPDEQRDRRRETTSVASEKRYRCTRCGHVQMIQTNHYGACWSYDHYNCCPECPPFAKYPEYGGRTVWECLDEPMKETANVDEP